MYYIIFANNHFNTLSQFSCFLQLQLISKSTYSRIHRPWIRFLSQNLSFSLLTFLSQPTQHGLRLLSVLSCLVSCYPVPAVDLSVLCGLSSSPMIILGIVGPSLLLPMAPCLPTLFRYFNLIILKLILFVFLSLEFEHKMYDFTMCCLKFVGEGFEYFIVLNVLNSIFYCSGVILLIVKFANLGFHLT